MAVNYAAVTFAFIVDLRKFENSGLMSPTSISSLEDEVQYRESDYWMPEEAGNR